MQSDSILPLLAAGRLVLAALPVPDVLKYDHQVSSPLTSFSRLQEGVFLFEHGIDPYSGGVFHKSPLLLSLYTTIIPPSPRFSSLLWAVCDIVTVFCVLGIYRSRSNILWSPRDAKVAAIYFFNPYLLIPSLALSTSTIENMMYLLTVLFACQGRPSPTLLALSLSTHLSLPTVLLLPPILMLLSKGPMSSLASPKPFHGNMRKITMWMAEYVLYLFILATLSYFVTGGWNWVPKTWGMNLLLPDLTPNPGLWWYFFTEMFDHFRPFFLMVFSMHLLIYVAPTCIKFQHDPLFAIFILQGIIATFKAYPTIADIGIFLSTISLFPEIYPYLYHPIVTALLHAHASLLLPLFHDLWLGQGTGNANFFYASTLVFGLANGFAVVDCARAGLRIAFGPPRKGFEVVQN